MTNTSSRFASLGVTAAVNVPSGLFAPVVTTTGVTNYQQANGTWYIGTLAPGATATLTIAADAGDVADGAQTITATVSAATYDPTLANNTASASEASQPAPMGPVITADPNNTNPVDVCAPNTPETWYGSAVNLANPAAPPPPTTSFHYNWTCQDDPNACPQQYAGGSSSSFVTYNSDSFSPDQQYIVYLQTVTLGTDPNYISTTGPQPTTYVVFSTICSGA